MEQNRNLYVGFDLGNENSQISCFHPQTGKIETIGKNPEDNYFYIPTCLFVTENKREWFFGETAKKMAEDGILIDNILHRINKKETFSIYNVNFSAADILEKFFRKTLVLLRMYYPSNSIKKLVVTVSEMKEELTAAIYAALANMGLCRDKLSIQTYSQSFVYYALNQKKELWASEAVLFDYTKEGLRYYRIHLNQEVFPMVVGLSSKDYTKTMTYNMLKMESEDKLQEKLLEISEEAIGKDKISTVYFAGEGFLMDWCEPVLVKICAGRRGFLGPNIYTRGACHSAKLMDTQEFTKQFLFLTDGILENSLHLIAYKDAKIREIELIPAGIFWKEGKAVVTVIFDGEEEIRILVKNVMEKEGRIRIISPEEMPKRPNKMGRYEIEVSYESINSCRILIKDKGFGDYAPSSNRIWEKWMEL